MLFCRFQDCGKCEADSATVHIDCLNLFRETTDLPLDRLWAVATGRYPWRSCPPLLIPTKNDMHLAVKHAAIVSGLEWLHRLPVEIATLIMDQLGGHILMRFCAVLKLVDDLQKDPPRLVSMPLSCIRFWRRGDGPPSTVDSSTLPVMLTLDSRGVRAIERASSKPRPMSGSDLFMVIKDYSEIVAELRVSIRPLRYSNRRTNCGSLVHVGFQNPVRKRSGISGIHRTHQVLTTVSASTPL